MRHKIDLCILILYTGEHSRLQFKSPWAFVNKEHSSIQCLHRIPPLTLLYHPTRQPSEVSHGPRVGAHSWPQQLPNVSEKKNLSCTPQICNNIIKLTLPETLHRLSFSDMFCPLVGLNSGETL